MPLGLSGQEFGSECNITVFVRKPVRSIYRGPRNKQKILQEKKNPRVNFVRKCPQAYLFKNLDRNAMSPFLHENMQVEYIYIGPGNKQKILLERIGKKKKKLQANFVRKFPYACLFKNLDQNAMSPFLHENMQVEYIQVQETNRKFFRKNREKKKLV